MEFFVGVSGFSYASWKGNFYPKDLKSEDFLSFYAGKLNSVEINSSFYAPPSAAMVKSWASRTGSDFRFAIKSPRLITHTLKLGKGASDAADGLGKTLDLLGGKLGPVLFQLPPFFRQDLKTLESFLTQTTGVKKKVFEFRHDSWLNQSTYQLLEKHEAGFCIAETEDMKPVLKVTGGLPYFRLRKDVYMATDLVKWTDKIRDIVKGTEQAYVYLRHDETGENASYAVGMKGKISS
ncbi:hypothetical protein AUI46_04065 [archaeon 13_1_40CM_2_52_13]|nr:MAG: hypothetical protein AUI46_04065 [archaeon 13_1_40CM_2_52_13]OLE70128.1 MAG: hypothetical protein AUF78_07855 [archaeon 13_1_20CM_2_51_12]TMI39254.1 MAG: DUF72 domain-containing protein [Candidatus Bathyarchaeota archaeon]